MTVRATYLLAGIASITISLPCFAQAQEQPPSEETKEPTEKIFRDVNGNPLPEEVQKVLREQFKNQSLKTAEQDSASSSTEDGSGEITVKAERPRGSITSDIPVERTFSRQDIKAYGASNIEELIKAIGPQVNSNGAASDSRPVTLLNGRRVSSFVEIAQIPSEAIERMEVFPEEVALHYGYQANQKVVNVVTLEKYTSMTARLVGGLATDGGYATGTASGNYFTIRGNTRLDFGAEYNRSSNILESERDVLHNNASAFRTLTPESERISVNAVINTNLIDDVSSSVNARYDENRFGYLLGLNANAPLSRDINRRSVNLGTAWHGVIHKWFWTFTGNYSNSRSETLTNTGPINAPVNLAKSTTSNVNTNFLLSGNLFTLPAGPVMANINGNYMWEGFSGNWQRNGAIQSSDISRNIGSIQANISIPIARQTQGSAFPIGDLSLNAFAKAQNYSDFDTLTAYSAGFNWAPVEKINIRGSFTEEESAPALEQLGAPFITTPNVLTFDFARNEQVNITRTYGGNPLLEAETRKSFRMGLSVKPFEKTDFNISADYLSTRTDNPIAFFPLATPELEAAFPNRFTRDAAGQLLEINGAALNFAKAHQEQIRWGFNFIRPLGKLPAGFKPSSGTTKVLSPAEFERLSQQPGVIVVQQGSALSKQLGGLTNRFFVSLYHTWQLRDDIQFSATTPQLNLLDGGATSPRGGNRRHGLEFQGGAYKDGIGARLTVNWQSGTTIRNANAAAGNFEFSDITTANVHIFANLSDLLDPSHKHSWMKGMRASFEVNNLFNSRPEVKTQTGTVPLNYQPAYLDPIGRIVSFSIRKVF